MNFRLFSEFRVTRQLSTFAAAALILATLLLVFAPSNSSQPAPRPPAWSVQSTDPARSLLTLKGSVIVGIDSSMFWVVQFRIEGSGGGQLASFQPNTAVVLESPGSKPLAAPAVETTIGGKAQPQPGVVAKSPTASAVFTGIPTSGQTLLIRAAGVSAVEGVVASVTGPQTYTVGPPGPPCCAVTAINLQTAIVTGKVNSNAQIFTFLAQGFAPVQPHEGPPPMPVPLVDTLRVGQPVWANLTTGQVSLDGKTPCCQITSEGIPSAGGGGKPPAVGVKNPIATTPACCTITALYPSQQGPPGGVGPGGQAGSVAAKVNSNGQVFVFVVDDITLFPSLKVGQAVWANFTTGQVSLDGKTQCCAIGTGGTPYSGAGVKPTPLGLKNPIVTSPACCEITALNQKAKTAGAKVKSNGQAFQIAVANPALFQSLRVGEAIWANFKTGKLSLNGLGPVDGMQIIGGGPMIAHLPGVGLKKPPYTAIPSPLSPPLTVHDDTLIMQAAIQNRDYLLRKISGHTHSRSATRRQIGMSALLYLIEANTVPESSKERVRVAFQTTRRMRRRPPTAADLSFRRDVSAAFRTVNDPSSVIQALSNLEQKYANRPEYLTRLNLAKTVFNDGASTIYSQAWLAHNLQRSTGAGVTTHAEALACGSGGPDDPSGGGGDDLGIGCFGGGCDPFTDPYCCDPATDPTCGCDPATDPNCSPPPPPDCTIDPNNLDCPPPPPDCTTDPYNPACPPPPQPTPEPAPTPTPPQVCPDSNNPICDNNWGGPGYCNDPTNPKCHWTPIMQECMESGTVTMVIGSNGGVKETTLQKGGGTEGNAWCYTMGLIKWLGSIF